MCADDDDDDDDDDGVFCARARARGFLFLGDWKKNGKMENSSFIRKAAGGFNTRARATTTTGLTHARAHKERLERSREEGYE